ncbi:terminase [Gordonia sp. MMO-8]|uniref:terminase n=1 Tax=Gordonia sp. MMO-8 TaxID=3127886 RepID=UPI003018136C
MPRLSEVARELVIPSGIQTSVFPRVYRRLTDAGVFFDEWQQGFGTVALGCREDGKYAATVGGVVCSWPRQVGKTFCVGNILIALCLEFPGLRCIWTSHHNRTTTNTFRSMQGMVRQKKIWPQIADGGIRVANGEQEIRFTNGSIIMFGAREQGFGRGMDAIDVEVFDEAQILGLKALEDMVPATNAAKCVHGGLLFFMGTPPRPTDDGEAFSAKRNRALSGSSADQMYCELSAPRDAKSDDRSVWPIMNPSHPTRTPIEAMLRMRENIPDEDSWRREAMGIWPLDAGGGAISAELIKDSTDPVSKIGDPVSFGAYVNRIQTNAGIVAAGYRSDGKIGLEVIPPVQGRPVDVLPKGLSWIAPRVDGLQSWSPCATVIDSGSVAASLIPDMSAQITETKTAEYAQACVRFYDALEAGQLKHQGTKILVDAMRAAKWRDLADSRAWDRKDKTSDITLLVAATLAVFGLVTKGQNNDEAWGFYG